MGKDKRKPLVELDGPNGKVKQYWESGRAAAAFYNISPVYISQQLKGRISNAKKHYFRYATDAEVKAYVSVVQRIAQEPPPVEMPEAAPETLPPDLPAEVIPDKIEQAQEEEQLTPFDRLIKKGKEKFK